MRDHRKFEIFALADSLSLLVYRATSRFPKDEQFGLTSQARRASVSIAANIVEGSARLSRLDFLRSLNIAYGSACELEYEISLAIRLGYVSDDDARDLAHLAARTCRALRSFIDSVRTRE